jgi:anti-sigma B factor antagonist
MSPEHRRAPEHPVHEREPAVPPRSPEPVAVTAYRTGAAEVVALAGEIDMATGPQAHDAIQRGLAGEPTVLVVDLTAVTFLSSTGLTALVQAKLAAGERTSVRVVADHRAVLQPIELTGLDTELALFPSLEQALVGTDQP